MTKQHVFTFAKPPVQARPRQITTNSTQEFAAVCSRQARGELVIESAEVGQGKGQWVLTVRYEK